MFNEPARDHLPQPGGLLEQLLVLAQFNSVTASYSNFYRYIIQTDQQPNIKSSYRDDN